MAGIYIHIPFCKQKCTYCDFHFSTTFHSYRQRMVECIAEEIRDRSAYLQGKFIETIYFGGGTPSILTKTELQQIFHAIRESFKVEENVEITLEANPDDINPLQLNDWQTLGINRLSIGLQSFKKSDLEWMNRAHSLEEGLNCIGMAQSMGFHNLSVDLMYGLPGLSMEEWKNHIQFVIDQNVPHISAYCLTVEKKTSLFAKVRKGEISPLSEELQSDQFLALLENLVSNNFEQYEISNFCMKGFESKHNSNYWKGRWYLGVGPSAHSFNGVSRRWNFSNNQRYIKAFNERIDYFETEELSENDRFNEIILTGLRTKYGVRLHDLNKITPLTTEFYNKLKEFSESKWLYEEEGTIKLSTEGRLRADFIASELFRIG